MKKIVKLTESELIGLIKRIINENVEPSSGDTIGLKCFDPRYDNVGTVIDPLEFVEYIKHETRPFHTLILKRPSNLPRDKSYVSGDKVDVYNFKIMLLDNPKLKDFLKIKNENSYIITYNVGGTFYCVPTKQLNSTWESFFKENELSY